MEDLPKQQAELINAQNAQVAQRFGVGGNAQGLGNALAGQQPQQPQQQSSMPLLPGRSPAESMQVYMGVGPEAYFKMVGEQGFQKPMVVSEGGTVYDPMSGQPQFSAAKNGIQTQYGPNGPQAIAVPGYGAANAAIQGAEAGAIAGARHPYEIAQNRDAQTTGAMLDLVEVPDGRGGTIKMPRSQAAQLLSGQGQAPAQGQGTAPALGTTVSPRVQEARQMLPKIDNQVTTMVNTIDQILNHKGLDYSVGVWGKAPTIPGTPQADVRALQDQIQGQAFLQAFESLKGGGAITEVEGKKAEQAIARLQSTQSATAYRDSLKELRGMLQAAQERAYKSADMQRPGSSPAGGVATPRSAQEMQSLPSGTVFRAPDGSLRKVP
jgi:hypothetical protein